MNKFRCSLYLRRNYLLSRISNPLFVQRMIESLPQAVKNRLNALKNLQMDYLNIETKFFEEVYALEKKYQTLYDPLLEKRCAIVNGQYEPTEAECKFDVEVEQDEEMSEKLKAFYLDNVKAPATPEYPADVKGVPEFWYNVFKNCDLIYEMVQEHDEPLIKKLTDVKLIYPADGMSYMFEFHFEKNDYFTNEVLTKQYFLKSELEKGKPFDYEGTEIFKCAGCKIHWNKGKDLTVRTIRKKQKHRSRGAVRMVSRQVPNDTFFNFFAPPAVSEEEDEEIDPETENILECDFNIGHYIRTRIIPRAVLIYAGIINDEEDDEDDEEEEEEEEDGDEGADDYESEETSDDDAAAGDSKPHKQQPHGKKKGGGGGHKGLSTDAAGTAANPECKQQ